MKVLNLKFIKERRKELKYSQQYMAGKLGMNSKSDYNRYENGVYSFNANMVPLLADALKVDLNDLFKQKVTKIEIKN